MADFSLKIAAARLGVTYTEQPTPHAGGLNVIVSERTGQFTYDNTYPREAYPYTVWTFSGNVGLPYIPAASLTAGSKWLIRYEGSIGSSDSSSMVDLQVCQNLNVGASAEHYAYGAAECNSPDVLPEAMNGSHVSGFVVVTGADRDIGFGFRSVVGPAIPVYYYALRIEAIPLDTLTEGVDYFYGSQPPDNTISGGIGIAGAVTDPFVQAWPNSVDPSAASFTVPDTGNYLVEACATFECQSLARRSKAFLREGSITLSQQWLKGVADTRDRHTFTHAGTYQYTANQSLSFSIWGANSNYDEGSGIVPRLCYNPRIFIWNLQSFEVKGYAVSSGAEADIQETYPSWQDVCSLTVTPYSTEGEYILLRGEAWGHRDTLSSFAARIYNVTAAVPVYEFTSMANVVGSSGDNVVLPVQACVLANSQTEWVLQVSRQGQGADTGKFSGGFLSALGLTKKTTPTGDVTLNVYDTGGVASTGMGNSSGSTFQGDSGVSQVSLVIDDYKTTGSNAVSLFTGSTPPPPSNGIPDVHPRLWIYGNDRLAYWVSKVGGTAWNSMISRQNSGYSDFRAYPWAIAYKASGNTSYRDSCINQIQSWCDNPPSPPNGPFQYNALITRDWMRDFAICYDLLFDELSASLKHKMEDFMMTMVYLLYNQNSSWATAIYDQQFNQGATAPLTNYYTAYMLSAMYVGVVLHGNYPADIGWPPGSTTNRTQFIIPFAFSDPQTTLYTDVYQFALDKFNYGYNAWKQYIVGGGWHEGSNYGKASVRHQVEILNLLKDTAGVNVLSLYPEYKDVPLFQIYAQQPGLGRMVEIGDEEGDLDAYNRGLMLQSANLLQGSLEGDYAEYWCRNDVPVSSGLGLMVSWDYWLAREDRAGVDYRSLLPPYYHADGTGFINSRNAWGADKVSVSFNAMDHIRDHQHKDNCQIQIFDGAVSAGTGGWILCDAKGRSNEGRSSDSYLHNTYTIRTSNGPSSLNGYWSQRSSATNNPLGLPVASIARESFGNDYTYALGDASDAYHIQKLSGGVASNVATCYEAISDIFHREFFHLRSLGYVVAYDRFRIVSQYRTDPQLHVRGSWHWAANQPVDAGGGVRRNDVGSNRLFRKYLYPPNVSSSYVSEQPTYDTWREDFTLPIDTSTGYGRILTLFQVATTSKGSMTTSDGGYLSAGGIASTMSGVTIYETTRTHVLFSLEQDGATPSTIVYHVNKSSDADKHYVCDLVPGQEYLVDETVVSGVVTRYTLTPTFNTGFLANSGGIVEFTPADLSGQTVVKINVNDVGGVVTSEGGLGVSSVATAYGDVTLNIEDDSREGLLNPGMGESDFSAGEDVSVVTLNINDFGGFFQGMGESNFFSPVGLNINDGLGRSVSSFTKDIVAEYAPPVTYREKIILSIGDPILPSADAGSSYCLPEPNDGVFWNKISDDDVNTFVRFSGPSSLYMSFANLSVAISDGNVYRGVIPRWRFEIIIRSADVSGIPSPVISLQLYERSSGSLRGNAILPFTTSNSPVTIESPTFETPIHVDEIPELGIKVLPRASGYPDISTYILEVSSVKIIPIGAVLRQKVIR